MTRRQLLRTSGYGLATALVAGPLVSCSADSAGSKNGARRKIRYQLAWLANAQILGNAVAQEKGYYADHGLDVEFREGGPNADPPSLVGSGSSPAGTVSSSPLMMTAVDAGVPVTGFAAAFQQHPWAFISMKSNPIRTPEDLIGKRIGTQPTSQVLVDAVLAKYDIRRNQVKIVGVGSDTSPLKNGQVDAWTGWTVNYGQLQPLGDDYETLRIWDLGIQLYAQVMMANDRSYKDDSKLFDGLTVATGAGWEYAKKHPEESVTILKDMFPNVDAEIETKAAPLVFDVVFTDATAKDGWGTMNLPMWEKQIKIYDDLGQFKGGPPKADDVMTLDVLERTKSQRAKL